MAACCWRTLNQLCAYCVSWRNSFARWRCCERSLNHQNYLSSWTWRAGRPHFGLCPIFLVMCLCWVHLCLCQLCSWCDNFYRYTNFARCFPLGMITDELKLQWRIWDVVLGGGDDGRVLKAQGPRCQQGRGGGVCPIPRKLFRLLSGKWHILVHSECYVSSNLKLYWLLYFISVYILSA